MKKKAALITGGAKRIGRAIALHLAKRGFDIALHYNASKTEAYSLAKEIEKTNRKCKLFQCNLTNTNRILQLIKKVKKQFPDLSLLINNASVFKGGTLLETDLMLFEETFSVNFRAPFFLSRDFGRVIKNGHIINILDTNIKRQKTKYFAYTLSKKILYELTKLSASELTPHVRVNAIVPGAILPPVGKGKNYMKQRAKLIPLKRTGDINDILLGIDFLLANNFVTGECLYIDGGENL